MSFIKKILGVLIVLACLFAEVVSAKNAAKKPAPKKADSKKSATTKGKGQVE